MIAALVCPAPSLASFAPGDIRGDLIIAVNRGVLFLPCDVWAIGDFHRFGEPEFAEVAPSVEIFTSTAFVNRILAGPHRGRLELHKVSTHDELLPTMPVWIDWTKCTATAALVLAHSRGAAEINCYGVDQKPGDDYDGHRYEDKEVDGEIIHGDDRGANRWRGEIPIWNDVCKCLASRGVTVKRIHPTKTE